MRALQIVTLLVILPHAGVADEKDFFDEWVIPGAQARERLSPSLTVTSPDKTDVQSVSKAMGQFLSEKPFHEVVRFYVHKSGLTPPNWSILGREFPGTRVHIPAHFSHTNFYREKASVTILHYIREEVATAQVLVTDHPESGFVTVSITRGKDDDRTVIQLIQHPAERIRKGADPVEVQADASTN